MLELKESQHVLHTCPNCDKPALAQIGNERFACLWCGFSRDLSRSNGFRGKGSPDGGFIIILIFGSLLAVLLLG